MPHRKIAVLSLIVLLGTLSWVSESWADPTPASQDITPVPPASTIPDQKKIDPAQAPGPQSEPSAKQTYDEGMIYYNGKGTEQDYSQALKLFLQAAGKGYAPAQSMAGNMYGNGQGIIQDYGQALKWIQKAADQGYAPAQTHLGSIYYYGLGTMQDYSQALKWCQKAADQGNAIGQFNVGDMYYKGQGTTQDYGEAMKWYQKAADQGIAIAQFDLGGMYFKGQGTTQDYNQAGKWCLKAGEQGYAIAQYNVGDMYYKGQGTTQDYSEALKWYQKAADQGHAHAQYMVGFMYLYEQGVIKDELEALARYNVAASQGDNFAISEMDALEKQLGSQNALIARQRAREILEQIRTKLLAAKNNAPSPSIPSSSSDVPKISGSGVFISSSGLILTAAHVVRDSSKFSVITAKGTKSAKVVQIDTANDVALLQCDGTFTPVPVRPSQSMKLGEPVFTIGFPDILVQGFSPKMTRGDISSLSGIQDDIRDWQISVPVQPGNSGGGLFDKHGNLVGLIVMKLNAVKIANATGDVPQNVNYAVKSYYFMPLLDAQSVTPPPMRTDSTGDEKIEDVVARVQNSVVLILAY